MVDVEQGRVICVEVLAHAWMNAGRAFALVADVKVLAMHGVHVGRRTSKVAQITFEVGQLGDGLDFAEDAFLAA